MEIQYLKLMQATPVIRNIKNEGFSESEIQRLESLSGVQLPKAYKEFLYLGGKMDNLLNWNSGTDAEDVIDLQETTRTKQKEAGYSLPRPFWNFADQDGGEVFLFFFLDEGDNPPVYYCERSSFDKLDPTEEDYRKDYNTFSDCIDQYIEWMKSGKI